MCALPQPDFRPLLRPFANGQAEPNAVPRPLVCTTSPSQFWSQMEAALEILSGLYLLETPAFSGLRLLSQAQWLDDQVVRTTGQAWSFEAEIPLADGLPSSELEAPLFILIEITVESGRIGLGLLAPDGSALAGERFYIGKGMHRLQLPVPPGKKWRGVVICNHDGPAASAHFRLQQAILARLDRQSPAFLALNALLSADLAPPPPEVNTLQEVEPCLELMFHYLLATDRLHEASRLAAAITQTEARPTWLADRLVQILSSFADNIVAEADTTPKANSTVTTLSSAAGTPVLTTEILGQLQTLRQVMAGAELIPLQLELLETVVWLDLAAAAGSVRMRIEWECSALAADPVPRGQLRNLLALILERLRARHPHPLLDLSIVTEATGTRLNIRSQLESGALQYREYTVSSSTLHASLHDRRCPPPHIEHHLGKEGTLNVTWSGANEPMRANQLSFHRLAAISAHLLYDRGDGHRVYREGIVAYKFAPSDNNRSNTLMGEAGILRRLSGSGLAPEVFGSFHCASSRIDGMSYLFSPGQTLADWAETKPDGPEKCMILHQLSDTVIELNRRDIQHRDLRAENVLLCSGCHIMLLDFDQARVTEEADDFGNEWASGDVCASFGGLIRRLNLSREYLRSAGRLSLAWKLGRLSAANSPGKHSCYYDWQWGSLRLEGERPWHLRWLLLQPVFARLPPGRFLELGCNLGLLSAHASRLGWNALGLDQDELIVLAAGYVAEALSVNPRFCQGNLTKSETFARLDATYDLVAALSVVQWLPDPRPIEDFLRQQPRLLFEGHRSLADETAYLRTLGFSTVEFLGYTERLRPLLLATR